VSGYGDADGIEIELAEESSAAFGSGCNTRYKDGREVIS